MRSIRLADTNQKQEEKAQKPKIHVTPVFPCIRVISLSCPKEFDSSLAALPGHRYK
jgi:hypothetical protein